MPLDMNIYVALGIGFALAALGGELFVRGIVGLARWLRVPPGIIGATLAAFATSAPELSVAVNASLDGVPQIALGDALGSNVVNVAFVLGLTLMIAGITVPAQSIRRDAPVAMLAPVLTLVLLVDGSLSRLDAIVLVSIFSIWLIATSVSAWRIRRDAASHVLAERVHRYVLPSLIAGLVLLVLAGRFVVYGANGLTAALGIDGFIVGATIVSLGTSMPEIATAIVSKLRGHDEVSLGTILGSNIFNGLLIIPVAALIRPIEVPLHEVGVALGFGLLVVALTYPTRARMITRRRGVILLALYGAYLVTLLQGEFAL